MSYSAEELFEIRVLKSFDLLKPKGMGKTTYYVAGTELSAPPLEISAPLPDLSTPADVLNTVPITLNTETSIFKTEPPALNYQ